MAQNSPQQQDPFNFTDQWIECSRVIKRALDIIYTLDVGTTGGGNTNLLYYVIDFAQKWGVQMIIDLLHKTLEWAAKSDQPQQSDHFLLSLKLKDNVLASQFFGHRVEELWYNQADTKSAGSPGTQSTNLSQRKDDLPPNNLVVGNERIDALIDYSKTYGGDVFDLGC